jgi:hypothetical protein
LAQSRPLTIPSAQRCPWLLPVARRGDRAGNVDDHERSARQCEFD